MSGKHGETLCCYFSVLVALDEDALSIASYTTNGEETQSAQTYYIYTYARDPKQSYRELQMH